MVVNDAKTRFDANKQAFRLSKRSRVGTSGYATYLYLLAIYKGQKLCQQD